MFWSRRKIKKLKERSMQARGRIQDLFTAHVVRLPNNERAWGQFFNENTANQQYGIYGTSAGVQVLSQSGYDAEHEHVAGGCSVLTSALENPEDSRFQQKGDIGLLYKVAFIAEACPPGGRTVTTNSQPMDELIRRRLPNTGWGEFYFSEADKDVEPKVTPTAYALLALNRYRPFLNNDICQQSVIWLCRRILNSSRLGISEVALATLALIEYRTIAKDVDSYQEALEFCRERLITWIQARKYIGVPESYHYASSSDGSRGNMYLFFLPDCLVAICLLKFDSPSKQRKYLLKVINFFVGQVLDRGGFAPDSRRQVSTVDHLWIFRLLTEFDKARVNNLMPPYLYVLTTYPRLLRFGLALVLLLVGGTGAYLDLATQSAISQTAGFRIVYIIVSALGIGLCVEILSNLLHERE